MAQQSGRRLRSKRLRNLLWMAAGGKCAICGCDLPPGWHADHVMPWSVTEDTNVHEMQALCPKCNLKKGDSVEKVKDLQHQADLRKEILEVDPSDFPLKILAWVVPGGGKSRLPGILAEHFRDHKIGWFVPRLSLQRQAVKDMKKNFGIELRDAGNDVDPTRGLRGFVATHDALMTQPELWQHELRRVPYVVIVDESHHAKVEKDGVLRPLASALSKLKADVWLNMTGTLETNDGTMIWGMEYDTVDNGWVINPEKSANIYIRYTRQTALDDGQICPIEFHQHDGPIRWKPGIEPEKHERISQVEKKDEGAAIFTALRTEVAVQLFEGGVQHWRQHSKGKLIVVVDRQENARKYAKLLQSMGLVVALAIDDNPEAQTEIDRFRFDPNVKALVTCQMAYEGLDVPEVSHIICLTHIRSVPWIEQMLARAWRRGKDVCWAFVPDDPRMNRTIKRIHDEQPDVVREPGPPPPPGNPPEPVLALDGLVDKVKRKLLDGDFTVHEAEKQLIQLVKGHGLTGTEPEVVALLNLLKNLPVPVASSQTPGQRESNLRCQIADEARDIDRLWGVRRGLPPQWGETQGRLIRLTDKSIKDMNEEELKRAYGKLQSLRP